MAQSIHVTHQPGPWQGRLFARFFLRRNKRDADRHLLTRRTFSSTCGTSHVACAKINKLISDLQPTYTHFSLPHRASGRRASRQRRLYSRPAPAPSRALQAASCGAVVLPHERHMVYFLPFASWVVPRDLRNPPASSQEGEQICTRADR